MTTRMSPWRFGLALALAAGLLQAQAQTGSAADTERRAAAEAAEKAQISGPHDIALRDQAVLKLPAGYHFVPKAEAARLLASFGNTPGSTLDGIVVPASDANWFAVIRYVNEGHIKDDDAKNWNADDLLKSLREGTEASNEERARKGMPAIEVVGWAEPPRYDAATHRLVWSASTRRKEGGANAQAMGVNYNTYALGREGYISLNLVTDLNALPSHKSAALDLLAALQFNEGRRYTDFSSSTDKVAAYGLASLVAGAAAKKLGLFAVLLAFFAKFAKVIIMAGGALLWGVFKLLGGRQKADQPAPGAREATAAAAQPPATAFAATVPSALTPTEPAPQSAQQPAAPPPRA